MKEVLWRYLIGPIIADAKGVESISWNGVSAFPGYNFLNTFLYALTALGVIYLVYKFFNSRKKLKPVQAVYSIPFILLGGSLRFLDDAQLIPYPFSILLITPIIYFLIAGVFVPSLYKLEKEKHALLGTLIFLPVLAYSIYSFKSLNYIYMISTVLLTIIFSSIYYLLANEELKYQHLIILVFTQLFEGLASSLSTFYGYEPKQILAKVFNNYLGFPGVFIMKLMVLAISISIIRDIEDSNMKTFALIILYSVGLGTGFRVFLRAIAGA